MTRQSRPATTIAPRPTSGPPRGCDSDFFVRKAIGWALRQYARTDPDAVRAYLAAHPELSGLSRREAAKHLT